MTPTINLLTQHRSIRKFTDEVVDPALFTRLIEAGQAAASSSFLQGVTIIRVTEPDKRAGLRAAANDQAYVETAPEFLVFCADLSRPMRCCTAHGSTPAKGLTEQFIIATVDAALFAQNIVIAAESAGLGICYIGALRNDPAHVTELLSLPQQVYPVFGLCLGHPAQDPEVKPRMPVGVILKENTYSTDGEEEAIAVYDEDMRTYYSNRSANIKVQGWSDQMAGLLAKERRPHMLEFLRSQGFLIR